MKGGAVLSIAISLLATHVAAVEQRVPHDSVGKYVRLGDSCSSPLRLEIGEQSLTLIEGEKRHARGDVDLCFSCEGGARYSGMVVWVFAGRSNDPGRFVVRLNAGEQQGRAVVEFPDSSSKGAFPLEGQILQRCAP